MQTKTHYSSSHCSCCKLARYSSQLFTKNLQQEDCQQLDSAIADVTVLTLGFDTKHLELQCHITS